MSDSAEVSRFAMARSRGAITGTLMVILGAWGAVIPFIGHYFSYGYTPNDTWHWTAARFWLEVLPGIATVVAGLRISTTADRISATIAGWLAGAAGAWFVIGIPISPIWSPGFIGFADGGADRVALENIGMFSGLGVVIVLLAAVSIGRASVVGVRDVRIATRRAQKARAVDVRDDADAPTAPAHVPSVPTAGTSETGSLDTTAARNESADPAPTNA